MNRLAFCAQVNERVELGVFDLRVRVRLRVTTRKMERNHFAQVGQRTLRWKNRGAPHAGVNVD